MSVTYRFRARAVRATLIPTVVLGALFASAPSFAQAPGDPPPPASAQPPPPPPRSAPPANDAPPTAPTGATAAPVDQATQPGAKGVATDFTTLRILRQKGIITEAEYDSALRDLGETNGLRAADANTFVLGRWSTTMYGFVEADHIFDTTRSFGDLAGNGQVARPGTIGGDNGRFMMGVRNSRIGFRMRAPETNGIRTSAMLEMDFLGTQLPVGTGQPYLGSEGAFFTNPTFRIRHFNMKVETPIVDILVGQYWQLFGWQSAYQPNSVEIQGVPGEVYSRTPQIRISKTFKTEPVTFEAAVAATRPVQRDGGLPDGQGGLRLAINKWTGMQTVGSTGTSIAPMSLALTGYMRNVSVDEFAATPKHTNDKLATGVAIDAFIPVIPATKDSKGNSLSVSGEFASGYGGADMYTGLTGGVGYAALPNPTGATPAPAYTPNIDSGIVTYGADGVLHYIQWTSYLVGVQYYLPATEGRVWLSANYSHMQSSNSGNFGGAANKIRLGEDWFDANIFADVTPAVRLGFEAALFDDQYRDGTHAKNTRYQLSGWYLF
jgi:hypothetical protein